MIDEKKIEEAANEYANRDWISDDCCLAYEDGFKAGINWFLDNLWHDASEEPKEGKLIICDVKLSEKEIAFRSMDKRMFIPDLSSTKWKELCKLFGYTRWLYLDDLLKGGK